MGKGKGKIKVKGGKKGQGGTRWNRGDSCISNPQSRKFRDAAASHHFLHQVTPNALLTVNNLESRNVDSDEMDDDVLSADVRSLTVSEGRTNPYTFASYKTFASDWSKCSNRAFERFLSKFKFDSALHKDMLAILAATTEVINGLGGSHKETEYFASFIATLDNCEPSQYPALTALFSIIVSKVPESVLKLKFFEIYPKIGFILSESIASTNHLLTRTCCNILRKIVGIQDPRFFEEVLSVQSLLYKILTCCLDENPKVRKKARQTVAEIMNRQKEKNSDVVQRLVLGWIRDQLSSFPNCGTKVAGDALSLLQFIWSFIEALPDSGAQKVFESILRVMSSGEVSIMKTGFSLFSTIFKNGACITFKVSPVEFVSGKVLSAIWKFCPDWRNFEAFISWLRCILDGLIRLSEQNEEFTYGYISLVLEKLSPTWTSSFGSVTSDVLTEYLQHIIKPSIGLENVENYFKLISRNLISIPPNPNCLRVLSALLNSLTSFHFCPSAREILLQLIPLRLTTNEVGNVLGLFVKAFGIERLWNSVSQEFRFSVILPLARDNLHHGSIQFWKDNILPFAKHEEKAAQVWDSFVGFCREPEDAHNFPAELLGKVIVNNPTIRLTALAALRQFGMWSTNKDTMEKYARNYLPLLFNLFIQEKEGTLEANKKKRDSEFTPTHNRGHADAIGVTIQEYLSFCEIDLILELVERATLKFSTQASNVDVEKSPLLDLMTFLASAEISSYAADKLFEISSTLINDANYMKKVYRIFTALLENERTSDELKSKICQLVRTSKGQAKSNTEPMRLNCINGIMLLNETWMFEFLPEIILNLLSVNTRARKISLKIVKALSENLKERGGIGTVTDVIELGLKSGNAFVTACTIHFMTSIYRDIRPEEYNQSFIIQCINLVLKKEDSSITRESLAFISLNLSLYKSRMGLFAKSIGDILAGGGLPRRDMNRILAKMIKIFGVAGLKAVLPNSDDPKMHNRLKNLQKKLKKVRDSKTQEKLSAESREDENEESDEDVMDSLSMSASNLKLKSGRGRNSQSQHLVIKEGVVDFLDPEDMTASLINKPREVKEEDQFKFAPDGRLIINEPSSKLERGKGDNEEEDLDLNYEDELPRDSGSRKRKQASGCGSIASSRQTKRSVRSSTSSFAGSKKSSSKVGTRRTVVPAKRRKSNSSNASIKSKNSFRSKKK